MGLPAHGLIKLISGYEFAHGKLSDFALIEVFPLRRSAGTGDGRWLGRLAMMFQNALDGIPVGDKGDDPHGLATLGAKERKDLINSCQQHRP